MTGPAARAAASPATGSGVPANRWAVLALVGVAQLMIVLDVTIVNIALPSAQQALHSRQMTGSGSSRRTR